MASKIKSLALKPHFLKKCPVFGSWTAVFFELLKFCTSPKKFFVSGDCLKKIFEDFFLENTCACVLGPWPREGLSSEGLSLATDFFCVLGLGLEPYVLDSTLVLASSLASSILWKTPKHKGTIFLALGAILFAICGAANTKLL